MRHITLKDRHGAISSATQISGHNWNNTLLLSKKVSNITEITNLIQHNPGTKHEKFLTWIFKLFRTTFDKQRKNNAGVKNESLDIKKAMNKKNFQKKFERIQSF